MIGFNRQYNAEVIENQYKSHVIHCYSHFVHHFFHKILYNKPPQPF